VSHFEMVDVERVVPAHWNYKTDDDAKQKDLVERIKKRGQVATLVVRELENGMLESVDGSHRIRAFKELGIKKIMVCNLGRIDQTTAEQIGVEINEFRFDADPLKLDSLLKRVGLKPLDVAPPKKLDLAPSAALMPDVKPIMLDPGPKPKTEDARPSKTPIGKVPDVQHYETNMTMLQFRVELDVARQFREQLDRVKSAMFPNESTKDVKDTLPIQAICQALAELPKSKFEKRS
jgi:hypothetical protein